jgi:hypothetical protein
MTLPLRRRPAEGLLMQTADTNLVSRRIAEGGVSSATARAWVELCAALDAMAPETTSAGAAGNSRDAYGNLLMTLMQAYLWNFCTDSREPDWIPFLGSAIRSAAANPDTVYGVAPIDSTGVYRLSGMRGSVLFADILVQAGVIGVADTPGPTVAVLDLTDLPPREDGVVDVILSAERPSGYDGPWLRLDPGADHIWLRQVAYDWESECDFRLAIERLDDRVGKADDGEESFAARLRALSAFVERYTSLWRRHIEGFVSRGLINRLELQSLPDITGQVNQGYYQGIFEIPEEMALVLEVKVPSPCRYWSVQLTDEHYVSIDWIRRQSSLNGQQARVDEDGRFRAVISVEDPGVSNWLDTGGRRRGTILGRWNRAPEYPLPTLTLVPLAELGTYLPSGVQTCTPEQRKIMLRRRARGAQLRRRW